jgi:MFS transporter, DHA2 family, methylenomycin A resistance protein
LRREQALTLTAMSLGYGVVQLDVTIVNTALHSIAHALQGGISGLQWIVSAYTISFAALILTAGALGDRLGARRVFMVGFSVFTVASLGCALAPSVGPLIAARAVQGLGAAILVPNSLALLNHTYASATERGRAVAIWAAGASLALTAGPLAGGALVSLAGWRSIFLVNLPIGLIGLGLTLRYGRDTEPARTRRLDLPGQLLGIAALAILAGAMIEAGGSSWRSPWVLGGIGAALLLGVLFIAREAHTPQPMLPLDLFRHRRFSVMTLCGLLVNVAFYGLIFVLSLYFQQINHYSPFATGLAFLPMLGAVLPLNLLAPRLGERLGTHRVIALGAAVAATGCLGLLTLGSGTAYAALCGQLLLLGAGLGLLVPPLTSELLGSVEKSRSGLAAAVLNSARQTGSVLGVALFGSLIGRTDSFITGTHIALSIAALLLFSTAAASAFGVGAPRARRRDRARAETLTQR